MVLIELHITSRESFWVNPRYIVSIVRRGTGSAIWVVNDVDAINITESPEEIFKLIKASYEQN